jgi:CRP/FNR family cyclic AMP-dependent transcriptional regulator
MSTIPARFRGKTGHDLLVHMLLSQKIVEREDEIAHALAAISTPMVFEAVEGKSTLITEGDTTTDIYFVLTGEVSIRIKRREVAIRYPSDHVGEMALIDPIHARSASVIATKRTEVARVSRQDFLDLTETYPRLWERLCIELGNRLRQRGNSILKPNAVPVVFIGSSTKQIPVMDVLARAIAGRHVRVKRWSSGVFVSPDTTIEGLEAAIGNADFAVIIFAADDKIFKKNVLVETPRDNCVFELGMGMGGLGRGRTFFLKEEKKGQVLHLPSDLKGVTYFSYNARPPAKFKKQIKDAARQIRAKVALLKAMQRDAATTPKGPNK